MMQPSTLIVNRREVIDNLIQKNVFELALIIDSMADDMRDLIEANRKYSVDKYGDDYRVESYYCVKKLRQRLQTLGYVTNDTGGQR